MGEYSGTQRILEGAGLLVFCVLAAPVTNEQRIRGKDAAVDFAVVVTGYDVESLASLGKTGLHSGEFERRGAASVTSGVYRIAHTLSKADLQ